MNKIFSLPKVLTIAGSDPSGGAGIQADIKTMAACRCYSASIVTALTAQNTRQVNAIQAVSNEMIHQQLKTVLDDISFDAIKIGMLLNKEIIFAVAENIASLTPRPFIVLDPVMTSTSGSALFEKEALNSLIDKIFPLSSLLTPNILEAELLLGEKIEMVEDPSLVAKKIVITYGVSCLLKGGHQRGRKQSNEVIDTLCLKEDMSIHFFKVAKVNTQNSHGTGCALSSAIAAFIALGNTVNEAVKKAQQFVYKALESGKDIPWKGNGPIIHHFENG